MLEKYLVMLSMLLSCMLLFSTPLKTQNCSYTLNPDLPLLASNTTIEEEINLIIDRYKIYRFGDDFPSATALTDAISQYNSFNISVVNGVISGETINKWSDLSYDFIKTFGQQLHQDPNDADIADRLNKIVWWLCQQYCDGTIATDTRMYSIDEFARSVVVLKEYLEPVVQDLFAYTLYQHTKEFEHFWEPNFDYNYQLSNDAINTDMIHNLSDVIMLFVGWQSTPEERYRYMRGVQRWMSRFCSYTYGTTNGIKKDGTSYHHWNAYVGYMNGYKTISTVVYHLRGTQFQIPEENYKILRDAMYTLFVRSTDKEDMPLSLVGRHPNNRWSRYIERTTRFLAIAGGEILNLPTPDPILAGQAIRLWGAQDELVGMTATPLEDMVGYYQFNHNHTGVYRYDNWLASSNGFSDNRWGTEIYGTSNRYGRYQSYGTLEIMYPGEIEDGNGYDAATWDWNYPAGATTIVLPWEELHAERERIDELQQKKFVGALTLQNKEKEVLNKTHGAYGIFAMDFQEATGLGWGTTYGPEAHNETFTFKKSNFFLDDMIISLGSNINNDDTNNPTVTTLYQRLDNNTNDVIVNGNIDNGTNAYISNQDNWLISNYGTGFYIRSNSGTMDVWQGSQQTPNYNQTNPNDYTNNATADYAKGYLNHGMNPQDAAYEYLTIPNADVAKMNELATNMQNGTLYEVHQKNNIAHILEYKPKNIWGYAFFEPTSNINEGVVKSVDHASLVMTKVQNTNTLLLSVANPDLGFESREFTKSILKKIKVTLDGQWHLNDTLSNVSVISSNTTETILEFDTVDGLPIEVNLKKEICTASTCLEVKAFLQGALVNSTDDFMRDDLRNLNYIPTTEPYANISHFNHYGSGGGETINNNQLIDNGIASVVDWVLLELRDATDPSIIIETQAVLLQRDGNVVDTEGNLSITFNTPLTEFFVAIRHRNHLGVMTREPINSTENNFIDFSDTNTDTWGTHSQISMGNGIQALWAGNTTIDNQLIFQGINNEPSSIFFSVLQAPNNNTGPNFVTNGYFLEDANLDGQCIFQGTNNETNLLFFNIIGFTDNINNLPNYIIWEQLP